MNAYYVFVCMSVLVSFQARSYGVAWGGKCHPSIIGCQLFATPGNFSEVLYYCSIL